MPYATQADLLNKVSADVLEQLTDLEEAGSIDTDVLAESIARADAEIDTYLRVRGETVPLTDVPNIVTQLSVALTLADLYENREAMPDTIKDRREWARDWLRRFAKGEVSLADEDHESSDRFTTDAVEYDAETRVYTRDNMKGW